MSRDWRKALSDLPGGAAVDTHVHTNYSDGTHEPAEVVRRALAAGLAGIAISDHDTIEGYLDAERLLNLLNARRPLRKDELALMVQVKNAINNTVPEDQVANYPLKTPQVAVRYQRWNAALLAMRNLWHTRQPETLRGNPLTGYGLKPYHEIVNPFMPDRLQYRTDEPEVFNVAAPEPMTHNVWLKTAAQSGLLGLLSLVWLVGHFLGRATRLHGAAHSDLMLGLALAVVGGVSGFALAGIFTENIARGLALPFVFLCSLVVLGERIVHGEPQKPRWELSRYD